jgi:hypothetical protein
MNEKQIVAHLHNPDGGYAKLEGTSDLIHALITPFLKNGQYTVSAIEPLSIENTPAFYENAGALSTNAPVNGSQPKTFSDLPTLYRKTNPKNQSEEVLLIAYYLKHYKGMQNLKVGDFEQSYAELISVPVTPPTDMGDAISNAIKRTKWLRRQGKGCYILTLTGEDDIETMLKELNQ